MKHHIQRVWSLDLEKFKTSPRFPWSAAAVLPRPLDVNYSECFNWTFCRFLINTWPRPPTKKVYQRGSISTQNTQWAFPKTTAKMLLDDRGAKITVVVTAGNRKEANGHRENITLDFTGNKSTFRWIQTMFFYIMQLLACITHINTRRTVTHSKLLSSCRRLSSFVTFRPLF